MIRNSAKEPAVRKPSGIAHLMNALHQNASNLVNSASQQNGPDQVNPNIIYQFSSKKKGWEIKLGKRPKNLMFLFCFQFFIIYNYFKSP